MCAQSGGENDAGQGEVGSIGRKGGRKMEGKEGRHFEREGRGGRGGQNFLEDGGICDVNHGRQRRKAC
jgi:hypothetical protein